MTYDFKLKNGREPTATEMLSLRVEADLYADQILAQPQEEGDDDDDDDDDVLMMMTTMKIVVMMQR